MSNGSWFHWSVILWKKLYFKTLVLAYFFFKVKESLALSEKRSASEWKSIILLMSISMLPLSTLYKKVTSASDLLNWSIDQYSEIHSPLACPLPWFPDLSRPCVACMKRGCGETYVWSQSLLSQSAAKSIPTSGKERFKYPLSHKYKIGQMPYPRDSKDNQIATPCPCLPLPRRLYIDRCITPAKRGAHMSFSQIQSSVETMGRKY